MKSILSKLKESKEDGSAKGFCLGVIIILLFHVVFILQFSDSMLNNPVLEVISKGFSVGNVLRYIIVIGISYIFFLVGISCVKFSINSNIIKNIIYILLSIVAYAYIYIVYKNETIGLGGFQIESILREQIRFKFYTYCAVVAFCILVTTLIFLRGTGVTRRRMFRLFTSCAIGLVSSAFLYESNIFKDSLGEYIHAHLYLNTIIKVAKYVPYNIWNHDMYGHYGLIYYLPVKILGDDLDAIMISSCFFGFITFMSAAYILNETTKNDYLFTVGLLALSRLMTVMHPGGNYYPLFPHRVLFPISAVALVIAFKKNNIQHTKRIFLEIAFGFLAIVWNLEMGIVSVMILIITDFLNLWTWKMVDILRKITKATLLMITSFVLAYIIVNVYNIMCGGQWESVNDFIYPFSFGGEVTSLGGLTTMFKSPVAPYPIYVVSFSLVLFPVLRRQLAGTRREMSVEEITVTACSASGLMALAYYMNRQAALNVHVSYYQLIIICVYIANTYFDEKNNLFSLRGFYAVLLLVFSIEAIVCLPGTIKERMANTWDSESYDAEAQKYREWIEEGTIACGAGVPEMYYQMGIDPGIYLQDCSDIDKYGREYFDRELQKHDAVIIEAQFSTFIEKVQSILDKQNFIPVREFDGDLIHMTEYQRQDTE